MTGSRRARLVATVLGLLLAAAACGDGSAPSVGATTGDAPAPVQLPTEGLPLPGATDGEEPDGEVADGSQLGSRVVVRVVGRRDHDTSAFTQGLEFDDGRLFESRGLYGESAITEIDPQSGAVLARTDLDERFFGEGATVVGDRILQITWRENTAFVYDRDTLAQASTYTYDGEGWGICDLQDRLMMTNGTPALTHRDPATFAPLQVVTVRLHGVPVDDLNEVECVDGMVWANVWNTDRIVVIDPASGEVVTEVDASTIALPDGRLAEAPGGAGDVLNGIAYDPLTDTWLLTGKRWPVMYEVEFDCVDGCQTAARPLRTHYFRPGTVQPPAPTPS